MPRRRARIPTRHANGPPADLPQFCDYGCAYADFAPAEASGACRRDLAVYCRLYQAFNNKHNACLGRLSPASRNKRR